MDFLELPLTEWRNIAYGSGNQEMINFIQQFMQKCDGSELFVLRPVSEDERDTGGQQAVSAIMREEDWTKVLRSWRRSEQESLARIFANMDGWSEEDE